MSEKDFSQLHAEMLEAIQEAVIATDLQGIIRYWNRAAEEMYLWRREDVLGKNIIDVTPTSSTRKQAEELMQALIQGESWAGEFQVQRKDGSSFWAKVTDTPIHNAAGELIGIIGVSRDLTEEKESNQKLKDRNLYIETILKNMPIGVSVNTIDDGNVKFMNSSFKEIYGWSQDELQNVSDFFEKVFPDPDLRKEMQTKIITDLQSGDPERMQWEDLEITTSTGEVKYVYAHNIPLPEQNLMVSTVQDFTARKLAKDELKKLNATLDERVKERTQGMLTASEIVATREARMAELKETITKLRKQLREANLVPVASDPPRNLDSEW